MSSNGALLSDHWQCFEGIIPTITATASRDGTPNITYISHAYYVDEGHIALSNQFMSKTVSNIMENPRLQSIVVNAVTGRQVVLDLVFDRSETSGPVFEQLTAQISAIAEHMGMRDVMKLRSADIYRVLDFSVQELEEDEKNVPLPAISNLLADAVGISLELAKIEDLDHAIQIVLDRLQQKFGFGHCMVLLADAEHHMLATIASRGYNWQGSGAEVQWGQGVIGIAAEKALNMRFAGVSRQFLYISNVETSGQLSRDTARVIPMPGLENPQALLAVPMIAGNEVRGVIFAESEDRVAFAPFHEKAVALIAAQLGSIVAMAETARELEDVLAQPATTAKSRFLAKPDIFVQFYSYDDSLFINNEYVIKGVPGRILWRMLQIFETDGRNEFTNREFRLDASLKLPEFKDNLETRLLLLSRRLAEKDIFVRIQRTGRGRVVLEVDGSLALTQEPQR